MKIKTIKLKDIAIDGGTQQRIRINDAGVAEYAEALQCGAKFPPVTVFFDGAQYHLVDGFHRYHAHRISETAEIEADVHEGTQREARLFSASVNGTHGIRLSNADKRNAVLVLINDEEWSQWSDNKISKHCKVTQPFVSKIRKEVITVITPIGNKANDEGVITVITPTQDVVTDKSLITVISDEQEPEYDEDSIRAELIDGFDPAAELDAANKEIDRLNKVIESNDQLATAMTENKRLTELARVLEERMRGYQSSENEAVRKARMWKNKFDALEKQVKSSGLVEF